MIKKFNEVIPKYEVSESSKHWLKMKKVGERLIGPFYQVKVFKFKFILWFSPWPEILTPRFQSIKYSKNTFRSEVVGELGKLRDL